MTASLTFGSPPGADDILTGAQAIAQQQLNQRQLGIQQYNAQTAAGHAQGQLNLSGQQLNLAAGDQALAAQQQAYNQDLQSMQMMAMLSRMQNSGIGQVGAQAIAMDNSYTPQGIYDQNGGRGSSSGSRSGGGSSGDYGGDD